MAKPAHKKSRAPMKEAKEYDEEVIQIDRVTRVVKGGRRLRFRATVAIGNRKGKVGIGIGKSTEVAGAIKKAVSSAKRNIIRVPLINETIPHDIKIKHKGSRIIMLPASEGTGIIAGGAVRKVVELAGIKNILSKSFGTNNRVVNTQATYNALGLLRPRTATKKTGKTPEKADKQPGRKAKTKEAAKNVKNAAEKGPKPKGKTPKKQPTTLKKPSPTET